MKNPNGNAACNNAIKPTSLSIDITGIKVPKKEEHPSEYSDDNEMLGLVLNAALDAIIWIDINGDISFWNQQAEQVFGWKMSEVIGKRLSTFIIPEKYRQRHDEGMAMYVKTGKGPALNKLLELSALKRSGEEFPIELTIVPIRQGSAEFFCAFIRDITARKLTEEKIKQSSARLMEAQEIAKMGSWETDLLNLQVIWSDETFRIFDTTPHVFEASHNAFLAFVHPEDKAMVDAAFVYSLGKNIDNSIEHRIITHTGLLKFVEERWRVVRDDSGIPVRAVGTCQDITDNKNAEAAIAKVNAEKILILDSIDDGFFAIDHNAMVTYWNRRAEILIGEKREKMIGRNLHEMFARPDSMQFYDNYQKAIREKITVHFEAFSKRTNKWFAVSAFPSENGSLSVYFKDVSGSREAADKIKLSEERYNLVSKATNDMVWDWDLLTNKVYRNKEGWKKIFRTSDADMDNISTDDWDNKIHPDDLDKVILAEKEIQNPAKDLYEVECRMLRDDGTYAIINDRGQIIRNEEG
ncbi:MAG: PAS domain S-box protein, partial [Ferruginibacter sp.]